MPVLRIARRSALAAALNALFASCAMAQFAAQMLPDAGRTMRELDRAGPALQLAPKQVPDILLEPERAAGTSSGNARLAVQAFRISGATHFAADELNGLLTPWNRRELSIAELQEVSARITRHYREHGYPVARAYLPAQEIRDGTVDIAVLEGRIGAVELHNTARIGDERMALLVRQAQAGDPVHGPSLERGLLLLNDTPGVGAARAALRPGASVGLSDLVVTVEPGRFAAGSVDIDNYGNRYSGAYRAGGTLVLNSPLGIGDQFTARVQGSNERLLYGRLAYRVPVGTSGLALGAAWSASSYRLGKEFADLDANGDARIASLFATYPLVRSRSFNLNAVVSVEDKDLQDRIGVLPEVIGTVDKTAQLISAGLTGDGLWRASGGRYNFSIAYTSGRLDIQSPLARIEDEFTLQTRGHYDKLTYAAGAQLPLGGAWSAWSFYAAFSGQWAGRNLDSSEKFALGGPDGVRAYPQGEAPADEGALATVELRRALAPAGYGQMQVAGFIDGGAAKLHRDPFGTGENRRRLAAAGFAFQWAAPGEVLVKASIGWKLGSEAATSEPDRGARAWLQAVKYF
ncbi:ShlB/FhaC/HecB family hemolysin secretion/activation protein [Noviherbaspirillum cavernae]|uniref:ShlB/FhaC/HecB family hemolysin secretion/activation protein n=1 Tax=Noviherbaspirillum cavernae TaxID=2320862 RepID=A0A418X3B8_9BURK|nr:ShlB/FhaC/HecB family hemolysin secretion/activation protein [Noviherbaspirillum cavernae]RJG06905.1 ShlB/FhaC/HecB family hemolysin secretion/activation protein [Noviherbaspirillum cavernae]